jgi:hypothetical protein
LLRCTHNAWRGPALLAAREFAILPRQLEQFLAGFERLACILMINGTDPHRMLERYVAVIRDLKKKIFAGASLRLSAADLDLARRSLQHPRFALRDRFRMPVLLKLNDLLAKRAQAIDPRNVSCEHILPVNPPKRGPWRTASFTTPWSWAADRRGRYVCAVFCTTRPSATGTCRCNQPRSANATSARSTGS